MAADPLIQDLRVRLKQVTPGPTREPELEQAIRGARGLLDAYMRLKVGIGWTGFEDPWPVAAAKTVWGWGTSTLYLPPHKIGSVSTVSVGGAALPSSSFAEDPGTGTLIHLGHPFLASAVYPTWGRQAYVVTAQWGYGPMDDGVIEVLLQVATNLWRGRDRGMWTDTINPLGAPALTFTGGLTAEQRMVLDSIAEPWVRHAGTAEVTLEARRLRAPVQGNW